MKNDQKINGVDTCRRTISSLRHDKNSEMACSQNWTRAWPAIL